MSRTPRLSFVLCSALLLNGAFAGAATAGSTEDARAQNAVRVLTDIQAIPESAIPDKLLDEAHAIVVVPDTIKAGLVIGGRRGHGLLSVKNADGTAAMTFVNDTTMIISAPNGSKDSLAKMAKGDSALKSSQQFVDKALLSDPAVYPDDATLQKLYTVSPYDPKTQRVITRTWTKIVTGQ